MRRTRRTSAKSRRRGRTRPASSTRTVVPASTAGAARAAMVRVVALASAIWPTIAASRSTRSAGATARATPVPPAPTSVACALRPKANALRRSDPAPGRSLPRPLPLSDEAHHFRTVHLGGLVVSAEPQQGAVLGVPLGHDRSHVLVFRAHGHRRPRERGAIVAGHTLPDLVVRVLRRIVPRINRSGDVDHVWIIRVERCPAEIILLPPIASIPVERPPALDEIRRRPLRAVEAGVSDVVAGVAVVLVRALVLTPLPQNA